MGTKCKTTLENYLRKQHQIFWYWTSAHGNLCCGEQGTAASHQIAGSICTGSTPRKNVNK